MAESHARAADLRAKQARLVREREQLVLENEENEVRRLKEGIAVKSRVRAAEVEKERVARLRRTELVPQPREMQALPRRIDERSRVYQIMRRL